MTEDLFRQYRVFPRVFAGFYLYYMSRVIEWAMTLENPQDAQWLVAAVVGAAAAFFKFYVESGNEKNNSGAG